MADENNTLFIKHLPSELTAQEQKELLQHFGAVSVKCMGNKGRLRYCAFATFENREAAELAIKRLHQLEVLDHVLSAEFAKKQQRRHFPSLTDKKIKEESEKQDEKSEKLPPLPQISKTEISDRINSISAKWGLEYAYNPQLEYMYPPPNVSILTNIANALASVPKFYVQVLHLMNKMNLPAPFGAVTATPPLPQEVPTPALPPVPADDTPVEPELPLESTEESEIESDEEKSKTTVTERKPMKRPLASKAKKVRKRPKLQELISVPHLPKESKTAVYKPEEVFETPSVTQTKKLDIKLVPQAETVSSANIPEGSVMQEPVDLLGVLENEQEEVGTGFGTFEPQRKDEEEKESADEEEEWGESEFISDRKLRKYRLSDREMRDYPVFRNYNSGEPTSRLYIKNIAKQVTEKDLHHIYGKYVDWEKEGEKIMFDIRLMKEGRMKGQAFITLPSETVAKEAVRQTNGYMLQSKPLVVQFARSAKPKENDDKTKKKS